MTPLYGGMTADMTFVTDEKSEVLYVSKKAIVTENGETYLYQSKDGRNMELVKVKTGFSDGINIEITEGLAEGDIVYIASKVSAGQSEAALKQEDSDVSAEEEGNDRQNTPFSEKCV